VVYVCVTMQSAPTCHDHAACFVILLQYGIHMKSLTVQVNCIRWVFFEASYWINDRYSSCSSSLQLKLIRQTSIFTLQHFFSNYQAFQLHMNLGTCLCLLEVGIEFLSRKAAAEV
jgi:hypothetical protein